MTTLPEDIRKDAAKSITSLLEANNKLSYGFWIVFLGGFALSLHAPTKLSCAPLVGMIAFRTLAVVGTGLNFFAQTLNIRSQNRLEFALVCFQAGQEKAGNEETQLAKELSTKAAKLGNITLCVIAAFLLVGLALSFGIQVSN